jgi:hypothetical protein
LCDNGGATNRSSTIKVFCDFRSGEMGVLSMREVPYAGKHRKIRIPKSFVQPTALGGRKDNSVSPSHAGRQVYGDLRAQLAAYHRKEARIWLD